MEAEDEAKAAEEEGRRGIRRWASCTGAVLLSRLEYETGEGEGYIYSHKLTVTFNFLFSTWDILFCNPPVHLKM